MPPSSHHTTCKLPLVSSKATGFKEFPFGVASLVKLTSAISPYVEFPKSIRVVFYDKQGNQEAFLKANYAKYLPKENRWNARGNVVVINSEKEVIFTVSRRDRCTMAKVSFL